MKTISTTAGRVVVEGDLEIVPANKPAEGTPCFLKPQFLVGDPIGLEASRDGSARLDRLLIETGLLAAFRKKSLGANRHEDVTSALLSDKPPERIAPCFDHPFVVAFGSCDQERLGQPRVGIGETLLKPIPCW